MSNEISPKLIVSSRLCVSCI